MVGNRYKTVTTRYYYYQVYRGALNSHSRFTRNSQKKKTKIQIIVAAGRTKNNDEAICIVKGVAPQEQKRKNVYNIFFDAHKVINYNYHNMILHAIRYGRKNRLRRDGNTCKRSDRAAER